jgi:hypothetical protein
MRAQYEEFRELWHGLDDLRWQTRMKWKLEMLWYALGLFWDLAKIVGSATRETYAEMRAERKTTTRVCWNLGCTPGWQVGGTEDTCFRCHRPYQMTPVEIELRDLMTTKEK